MKKPMIFLGVMIMMAISCKKEIILDTSIPSCMQQIIDDPIRSSKIRTIQVKICEEKYIYWMNTDLTLADGVEYILSDRCDTISPYCTYCINPPYREGDWTEIWRR